MRRLLACALGLVALGAVPASAHVTIDTGDRHPGAVDTTMAVLVQSEYPDGSLDGTGPGSPTTTVVLHLPATFTGVKPQPADGWKVDVDGTTVTWSDGSLASGRSAIFEVAIGQLPTDASVTAPVEQTYADGRVVLWHDAPTGTHPAPVLALDGSEGGNGITSLSGGAKAGTQQQSSGGSSHVGLIVLGVVAAGLVVGGALVLRRRQLG